MTAITQPLRVFAREQKISPTQIYRWADEGEIETVLIGARRHIVVESYRRMIERRRAEQAGAKLPSSNPKVKARQEQQREPGPRPRGRGGARRAVQ